MEYDHGFLRCWVKLFLSRQKTKLYLLSYDVKTTGVFVQKLRNNDIYPLKSDPRSVNIDLGGPNAHIQ